MIVDVSGGMTLAQVIIRLREAQGDSVTVRILPDSSLLLTANEFRALSLAAEREQVAIAVETDDALRRQLASLFGVPLAIPFEPEEAEATEEDGAGLAPIVYLNGADPATAAEQVVPPETEPAPASGPANGAVAADPVVRRKPAKSGRAARWFFGLAGLAALIALAVAGYWWFFGTATAQIMLQSQPVTTNVSFTVVAPGGEASENGAITIPGENVSFPLSLPPLEAPATGSVTVGDLAASGSLVLRNPADTPVEIAAGAEITTFEGEVFVFQEDVTVPAATPEGSSGETTAVVGAATPGAASNRDIGMLSGQLENGVYYSNRTTPVAGGTDHTVTVVTEEDIAGLQARAEQTLMTMASTANLSGNMRVVPSTLTMENLETTFNHQAGDEAESVTVEATVTLNAVAFPTEALDTAARELLPASVPSGYTLLPEPVTYDVPVETGQENGSWSMVVPATGQAAMTIRDEQVAEIERELAGMSESEAADYLEANELVTSFSLEFSPDWMPHRIPDDTGRIEVEVQ